MGEIAESTIALQPIEESDLDRIFDLTRDPESVRMAAFTADDPDDRQRFDAHMATIVGSSEVTLLAVTSGGDLVGTIGSFVFEGALEVTYWIDRAAWGQGIATRALDLFLDVVAERPLHARAASDNAGSLRVLHKAGFRIVGSAVSFAPARGVEIEEKILRLDDGQGP